MFLDLHNDDGEGRTRTGEGAIECRGENYAADERSEDTKRMSESRLERMIVVFRSCSSKVNVLKAKSVSCTVRIIDQDAGRIIANDSIARVAPKPKR